MAELKGQRGVEKVPLTLYNLIIIVNCFQAGSSAFNEVLC